MSVFLLPDIVYGDWVEIEDPCSSEESCIVPAEYVPDDAVILLRETGWSCRLSAPGYLDCTEWWGVFSSEQEARMELECVHEVCSYCGESLSECEDVVLVSVGGRRVRAWELTERWRDGIECCSHCGVALVSQ